MVDPVPKPPGVTVDAVDWLPSGARSGLVRVRGRRQEGAPWSLPDLVLTVPDDVQRFTSLPDPRADRDPAGWRGAYVVDVAFAAAATEWALQWPEDGGTVELEAPDVQPAAVAPPQEATPEESGGEVVERAVLAERRARRAEASEQAQARIAREALRAVEVLELRAAEVEARLEMLQEQREAAAAAPAAAPAEPAEEPLEAGDEGFVPDEPGDEDDADEGFVPDEPVDAVDEEDEDEDFEDEDDDEDEPERFVPDAPVETVAPRRDPQASRAIAAAEAESASLRDEVGRLRSELARRNAIAPDGAATEAERRVARLRDALTATITTVAELRVQLHDAQVARRTREVEWSAEAVRLAVLEREHAELVTEIDAAREELSLSKAAEREASGALHEARVRAEGAEAAHEETRRHFAERVAELRAALTRIEDLERVSTQTAAQLDQVRTHLVQVESDSASRITAAEDVAAYAEARLAHLEATIDEIETAREIAEATALAATAERRVAEVAHASTLPGADELSEAAARFRLEDPFAAAAARLRDSAPAPSWEEPAVPREWAEPPCESPAAPPEDERDELDDLDDLPPSPARSWEEPDDIDEPARTARSWETDDGPEPEVGPDLDEPPAADVMEEAAAPEDPIGPPEAAEPPGGPVAQPPPEMLSAAAEQVRVAAERLKSGDPAERERVVRDLAQAADALRKRATIVSAPNDPPGDLVRGRVTREYPPLRGALVKLAHDDGPAAARLIAGLLPAQHWLVQEPLDYDLTIKELGTFSVSAGAGGATVSPASSPRGRRHAAFHLRTDALTLAEMLAGVGPKPGRFSNRARVTGNLRRLKALENVPATALSLEQAIRAGATVDPLLALRLLSYAVPSQWTRGETFLIQLRIGDTVTYVCVRDGSGLTVVADDPGGIPHTRVNLSRTTFSSLLADEADRREFEVSGEERPFRLLREWLDRVRRSPLD